MVHTRVDYGSNPGYITKHEKVDGFSFPFNKLDFLRKWIEFVN